MFSSVSTYKCYVIKDCRKWSGAFFDSLKGTAVEGGSFFDMRLFRLWREASAKAFPRRTGKAPMGGTHGDTVEPTEIAAHMEQAARYFAADGLNAVLHLIFSFFLRMSNIQNSYTKRFRVVSVIFRNDPVLSVHHVFRVLF